MCIEITNNNNMSNIDIFNNNKLPSKKPTYSIKKLLKQIFKARRSAATTNQTIESIKRKDSLESLDNQLNTDIESNCSLESFENDANERISVTCELEDFDLADISNTVPVHFVRTEHGTFFWTAISEIPADNDLIEPLCCSTNNQIAVAASFADRWAQA